MPPGHSRRDRRGGTNSRTQNRAPHTVARSARLALRPQLLIDAAEAIARFDRPVLLIWGHSCDFFPITDAQRLASEFPGATLVPVPGTKTWVPIDNPGAVADAIVRFVPTPMP
jgi:pimeloyl-ACP methyl ester carboxylesterase